MIVTRPRASSAGLAAALRARGARVVFAPLINTTPPKSWKSLDRALRRLSRFDAVAFSSRTAVDFFFTRMKSVLRDRPRRPRFIAAVGPATAKALAARGWKCSVVPEDARAAGLARAWKLPRGARVLLPRAERGLTVLPEALAAAGARVTLAAAYRTVRDPAGLRVLRRAVAAGADAACFASGSAAAALGAARLGRCAAVAIGPTTAAALRARGLRAAAVARNPGADAFADAVARALEGKK